MAGLFIRLRGAVRLWVSRRKHGAGSTKYCPTCGNDKVIMLQRGMKKKMCYLCGAWWEWPLDQGQKADI